MAIRTMYVARCPVAVDDLFHQRLVGLVRVMTQCILLITPTAKTITRSHGHVCNQHFADNF